MFAVLHVVPILLFFNHQRLICQHDEYILSLQCYSVLSTIAQVLRKMKLKNLVSLFLMCHLSETLESYQRVKMCPLCVNNHDFVNIWK